VYLEEESKVLSNAEKSRNKSTTRNRIDKELKDNSDEVFSEVAASIYDTLEKIDINRLPMTGEELFGRQKELEMLDKA